MLFVVKKRYPRCRKVVRPDGTCQNEKCVLYVPEKKEETSVKPVATPEEGTSTEN